MRKLTLIALVTLFIFILAVVYIATVIISVSSISYEVGEVITTPGIEQTQIIPVPIYEGYLEISTPITLSNKGYYSIEDISVNITVYATDWEVSSHLDGELIGEGTNDIGDILPQESWNGSIGLNITSLIPHLAVEDCTLQIFIEIHLVYYPIISIPIDYQTGPIEIPYDAPFMP